MNRRCAATIDKGKQIITHDPVGRRHRISSNVARAQNDQSKNNTCITDNHNDIINDNAARGLSKEKDAAAKGGEGEDNHTHEQDEEEDNQEEDDEEEHDEEKAGDEEAEGEIPDSDPELQASDGTRRTDTDVDAADEPLPEEEGDHIFDNNNGILKESMSRFEIKSYLEKMGAHCDIKLTADKWCMPRVRQWNTYTSQFTYIP